MASGVSSDQDAEEQPRLETLLPKFYKQANTFQQLGKELETYVKGVRGMKTAMSGVHTTILSLCDKTWSRHEEFSRLLEDQAELWTMLESDIHKMGRGFQHFADEFYIILQSINCRKEKFTEMSEVKKSAEKLKKSSRGKSSERAALVKQIQGMNKELEEIDGRLVKKIMELQRGQKKFITEQYGQFLAAQAEFCKDSLAVLNIIPDILSSILPKPKPQHCKAKKSVLNI